MTENGTGPTNLLRAPQAGKRNRKRTSSGKRSPFPFHQVAVFLLFLLILAAGSLGYVASSYAGRIVPGVTVNAVAVGEMTPAEAKLALEKKIADLRLVFIVGERRGSLAANAPLRAGGRPLASFDVDAAVQRAFEIGHGAGGLKGAAQRLDALIFGSAVKMPATLDLAELKLALAAEFPGLDQPARNAGLSFRFNDPGSRPQISVLPERVGEIPDMDAVTRETAYRLKTFSPAAIIVKTRKDLPALTAADVAPLAAAAAESLDRAPLTLKADGLSWTITDRQLADWMATVPTGLPQPRAKLSFDPESLNKYLGARAAALRTEPVDAVFTMADGKVAEFRPSVEGSEVDIEAAAAMLANVVFGRQETEPADNGRIALDLPFKPIPPLVDTASSNAFGIREIIGVGESNFRGSPKNRRINIAIGAKSVNGTLIPAGEEFSLLKTLGDIDESQGYLQELVIKQDKTTPEFGGGLCQIGTTTFRATLAAGLPVTERRNHSYRVVYYERDGDGKPMGPGKDATIYSPWPDFKFVNDTGHAILITTNIDGDRLTFTFWGTGDGRKAEQTDAKVYNIVPPPEKKIIETADLKPGVTKCTESPHAGADAVFTYTVAYPDGEVKKTDFYSHYRPWGEVCLIGIDPNAEPADGAVPELPSVDTVGTTGN